VVLTVPDSRDGRTRSSAPGAAEVSRVPKLAPRGALRGGGCRSRRPEHGGGPAVPRLPGTSHVAGCGTAPALRPTAAVEAAAPRRGRRHHAARGLAGAGRAG